MQKKYVKTCFDLEHIILLYFARVHYEVWFCKEMCNDYVLGCCEKRLYIVSNFSGDAELKMVA